MSKHIHVHIHRGATKDHWYRSTQKVGNYEILEGAGVNGGEWLANCVQGSMKGDKEKFSSRAAAESYARRSSE